MEGRTTKKVDWKFIERVLYASVLVFIVAFAGAYTGYLLKNSLIEDRISSTFVRMLSLIEIEPSDCDITSLSLVGDELDRIGKMLSSGTFSSYLYDYYVLLEYKHSKMVESFRKDCNKDIATVYFFITPNCPECDGLGVLLTSYKQKYRDSVFIYTFNVSLSDSPIISYLINKYGINTFPSVVVNGKVCDERCISELLTSGRAG